MNADRNAGAVVLDDHPVTVDVDAQLARSPREVLVDGVADHLEHEVQ